MGKSFKPSGEPSVVQVQQRNHGDAAKGADGREQTNQWPLFMVLGLGMGACLL